MIERIGTEVFPKIDDFQDSILFLETSEDKPQDEEHYEEYKDAIRKVMKEFHRERPAYPLQYEPWPHGA